MLVNGLFIVSAFSNGVDKVGRCHTILYRIPRLIMMAPLNSTTFFCTIQIDQINLDSNKARFFPRTLQDHSSGLTVVPSPTAGGEVVIRTTAEHTEAKIT